MSRPASPWYRSYKVWASGLLVALGVAVVVANFRHGDQLARLLYRAQPAWLLVALALQVGTYLCAAGVWYRALIRQNHRSSIRDLFGLGLAKLFMDQAVPSAGLSGSLLVARGLKRRGVPGDTATTTVVGGLLVYYVAYGVAVIGGLAALWWTGLLSWYIISVVALFALVLAFIPAVILWMTRSGRRLPGWIERFQPLRRLLDSLTQEGAELFRDRAFLIEGTALQLGVIVLDAATLWVILLALGFPAQPAQVFASFAIASAVGAVSPFPGGLGSFDATVIGLLRLSRVPFETALGATVLLRGFTTLVPLVPGLWLARLEGVGRRKNEQAADAV